MAIRAHYFQAAATILQALLESPNNKSPSAPEHAYQAVEWVNTLARAAGDDPVLVMSAARLVAGFMKNPASAHCNKHELLHYAIQSARQLVAAFSGQTVNGPPQIAPIFANPSGPAPIATGVPQAQAAPPPYAPTGESPPPVFMPPAMMAPQATNPIPPQQMAMFPDTVVAVPIPDFSDLGGMR
jgi:hypothetical protein